MSEGRKVRFDSGLDGGMIGLVSLDDDAGVIKMSASDATDDLSKQLKSAFFGGEVWEREPGIGLNDTHGGEVGKI